MSDVDEYRAALKAKVDGMQRDQQEKSMLLDDTSLKQNLPTPSPEFIQAHVGNEPPMSEAEIKMKAWQELEQERTTNIEQPSNEAVWQTEKINTEFNRENERVQEQQADHQKEKDAQRQRDQEIADNKNRQIEADKEKQRLANEQAEREEQDRIQQQAAARDQAQRDKEQAQVNLAQQQPDNDYSQNRAMFEQAAARTQSMDREVE